MKSASVLFVFLLCTMDISAMIDPYYKEVMQRGYRIEGDSVVLPDDTKCLIDDFNNKRCGKEYFDMPYCVAEGNYVWDESACCEGLVPYLPPGVEGQAICKAKGQVDFSIILRNPFLWLGILAFTILVYSSLFLARKFIRK
ncbi:MAG: hypothetical protein POELPBGB_03851 [Bacteroidia bacterium]|nr:hypothetical protein [Bacteroidia bacterium]